MSLTKAQRVDVALTKRKIWPTKRSELATIALLISLIGSQLLKRLRGRARPS